MQRSIPWVCLVAFSGVLAFAPTASATIITVDVAEFTWTVDGASCGQTSPDDCLSIFSLTYLWNGPTPFPVVSGSVDVDGAPLGNFLPLDPGAPFDQLLTGGVPATAQASIAFFFGSQQTLLGPVMDPSSAGLFDATGVPGLSGASHLFQFQFDDTVATVPEPASFATVAFAVLAVWRARSRRR